MMTSNRKTVYLGKPNSDVSNVEFIRPDCECCGKKHSAVFNGTYMKGGVPYFRRMEVNNESEHSGKLACQSCLKTGRLDAGKLWAAAKDTQTGGYRIHRFFTKDYCENTDGRLGFTCTTQDMPDIGAQQYDVDHVDEDHYNNHSENLQTFCASCHRYKTFIERSSATKHEKILKKMMSTQRKSLKNNPWFNEKLEYYNRVVRSYDKKQQNRRNASKGNNLEEFFA